MAAKRRKKSAKRWRLIVGGSKRARSQYSKGYASKASAKAAMKRIHAKHDMGVSTIFLTRA
jgi:hypothetical protein